MKVQFLCGKMLVLASFGLISASVDAQGVLVTYEVDGVIGRVNTPGPFSLVSGDPFRIVFSYDPDALETIFWNTDGGPFVGAYVSGEVFANDIRITQFTDLKFGPNGGNTGLLLGYSPTPEGREGTVDGPIPTLDIISILDFRTDGRILPPGGEFFSTSSSDGFIASGEPPTFVSTSGELHIVEIVPEPGSAILAFCGAAWLCWRRRR